MNTTPQPPEMPEEESRLFPKIEDLAELTGLFSATQAFEELQELEKLKDQEAAEEQGKTNE